MSGSNQRKSSSDGGGKSAGSGTHNNRNYGHQRRNGGHGGGARHTTSSELLSWSPYEKNSTGGTVASLRLLEVGWSAHQLHCWKQALREELSRVYGELAPSLKAGRYLYHGVEPMGAFVKQRVHQMLQDSQDDPSSSDEDEKDDTDKPATAPAKQSRESNNNSSSNKTVSPTSTYGLRGKTKRTVELVEPTDPKPTGRSSRSEDADSDEDEPPPSNKRKSKLRELKEEFTSIARKHWLRAQSKIEDLNLEIDRQRVPMYAAIWQRLSVGSRQQVETHEAWIGMNGTDDDPVALWKAIEDTHSPFQSGHEELDLLSAQMFWLSLKQSSNQPLAQFNSVFDDAFVALKVKFENAGQKEKIPPESTVVMQYIRSLDSDRYRDLQVNCHNGERPYPATMSEAKDITRRWVTARPSGLYGRASGGQHSAFVLMDAATAFVTQAPQQNNKSSGKDGQQKSNNKGKASQKKAGDAPPSGNGNKKKGGGPDSSSSNSSKKNGGKCLACDSPDHYFSDCPVFKKAMSSIKKDGNSGSATTLTTTSCSHAFEEDDEGCFAHAVTKFKASAFATTGDVMRIVEDVDACETVTDERTSEGNVRTVLKISGKKVAPTTMVLLDNQATKGIFGNAGLLDDVHTTSTYITFSGIGGSTRTNVIGRFSPFGIWVYCSPNVEHNILSLSELEDRIRMLDDPRNHVSYEMYRQFRVTWSDGSCYDFVRQPSDLWGCDFSYLLEETVAVQTVKENEAMYSKRDVDAAKLARDVSKVLGYPAPADLELMLRRGVINNAPVTAQDVQRASRIYGPEIASLKGKTKSSKPTAVKPVPLPKYVFSELTMLCDIMFVEGDPYLVSVTHPLGLLMVSPMADRNVSTVRKFLNDQIRQYLAREFNIIMIWTDREGAVISLRSELLAAGIKVEAATANKHVPGVEVRIRVIKERLRAILNTLPFLLPRSLLKHLVKYVVNRINMIPSDVNRSDGVSPREAFIGRRVDFKIDCRIAFGACVQVRTNAFPTNSMAPRTELAIALDPEGGINGSVNFWIWRSKRVVTRDTWSAELPYPEGLIEEINALAIAEGKAVGKTPRFRIGNHEVVDIPSQISKEEPRAMADRLPHVREMLDLSQVSVEGTPDVLPANEAEQDSVKLVNGDGVLDEPVPPDKSRNEEHYLSPIERATLNSKVSPSAAKVFFLSTEDSLDNPNPEIALNISVKKAIETWGDKAITSILAELQQMVDMKVFHPVAQESLTSDDWKRVVMSHMFLKEKFDANGSFEKIKARLVAGGNTQDRSIYESVSSPTASLASVLMVAAIAANEKRCVKSTDVTGAYLNAPMGDVTVYMRITGKLAELLVQLVPEYAKFINQNGSIIVRLDKAMYGCIESARLWYNLLVSTLSKDYQMEVNPYDTCVLNKTTESGEQLTTAIYVDDILITCVNREEVDKLIQFLVEKFNTISVHDGPLISYLGMSLDFGVPGVVKITMPGYVNEMLDSLGVVGSYTTPATPDIFEIGTTGEPEPPLLSAKDAKEFHTVVAKLLYLAKRARPDILVAVTFLTTRVKAPNSNDNAKLMRVLKYLNGTRDLGICLRQDYKFPIAYCDASYGVHVDGKSHSGLFITLGAGPIYVGSSKQKIVVKSSTEAELVALSDSIGHIVWAREFMRVQAGVKENEEFPPAFIMEDNKSTIALLKSDKLHTQRTKHINIRYFFIKDRAREHEVFVRYIATEDMIADIFTKGVQGALFLHLRKLLLNS